MKQDFKAFSFQTQIVLIDDNKLFLNTLNNKLSNDYKVNSFLDSSEGFNHILAHSENYLITNASNFVTEITNEEDNSNYYSVEFSKIKSLVDNSKKITPLALS